MSVCPGHWSCRNTWVCTHVDFQNLSALPPESTQGNLGFTAEHLTLSRSLPLIRHHKDMEAPPPPFSQVTIETRPRKARGCRFRFEFSCCRNTPRPNTGRSCERREGGLYCHRFEKLQLEGGGGSCVTSKSRRKSERNEWEAQKEAEHTRRLRDKCCFI